MLNFSCNLTKFIVFQPKFELRKGHGHSAFQFTKVVERITKNESKINSTLKTFANDMMAPVIANFEEGVGIKRIRKESKVGQLAQRVMKKASFLSTSMKNSVSNSKLLLSAI